VIDSGAARKMEDCRPSGAALRGEASNRPLPRWLKTVVVSDEGKGARDASGGVQEGVALKVPRGIHRLIASLFREVASEPGVTAWPGMSLAVARIAGQVVPGAEVARAWTAAFVRNVGWRALKLPSYRKGGERESSKRLNREELSTVAGCAGGPARSVRRAAQRTSW
jgi:hypothetical protein